MNKILKLKHIKSNLFFKGGIVGNCFDYLDNYFDEKGKYFLNKNNFESALKEQDNVKFLEFISNECKLVDYKIVK